MKIMKLCGERPVLTFQFDVSTLQKQLRSVKQIHLDHSANFSSCTAFSQFFGSNGTELGLHFIFLPILRLSGVGMVEIF